jgi:hypothetical protein
VTDPGMVNLDANLMGLGWRDLNIFDLQILPDTPGNRSLALRQYVILNNPAYQDTVFPEGYVVPGRAGGR